MRVYEKITKEESPCLTCERQGDPNRCTSMGCFAWTMWWMDSWNRICEYLQERLNANK